MPRARHIVNEATRVLVRDYAVNEPSFTVPFASWELGVDEIVVRKCVDELVQRGVVVEIEPAKRPYSAVYVYSPPKPGRNVPRHFRELDESRVAGIGADAPKRGEIVPHTRAEGPSGKPGKDKKRAERGVRVKRQRQGT